MAQRKGMRDILTHGQQRGAQTHNGNTAYLRLYSLEMERTRLSKEKEALLIHLKSIEKRESTILEEQKKLRQKIELWHDEAEQQSAAVEAENSFKIRY
jgi:hypothetical protein